MAVVEHYYFWAQWVGEQLDREGTGHLDPTVVRSALTLHPGAERGLRGTTRPPWPTDHAKPCRAILIDLLVVDGPPAHAVGHGSGPLSRSAGPQRPPRCWSHRRPRRRRTPGEQEVRRRWQREMAVSFDSGAERGGVAVARMPAEGPDAGNG